MVAHSSTTSAGAATASRRCHGEPIAAPSIGTELSLALGRARGTGLYRPSPLVRVAQAAPYLHHGAVASLEDLLSSDRLAADFTGGTRGPGPIPGHSYGTDLAPDDRDALLAYLRTL